MDVKVLLTVLVQVHVHALKMGQNGVHLITSLIKFLINENSYNKYTRWPDTDLNKTRWFITHTLELHASHMAT